MPWSVPTLPGGWLLPLVLSTTAGAVDVIGFLALCELFTAHITGNIVVVAAHYVTHDSNQVEKLLAVPVFVIVLGVVTFAAGEVEKSGYSARRVLLILHALLLAACLGFAIEFGPFADADRPTALLVGMLAVAAMATQNALVRLTLPGTPSTAVMTTNITQLAVDLGTLAWKRAEPDELVKARRRASVTMLCVVGFVTGCAAGAALVVCCGLGALALPVALALAAVALGELWSDGPARQTGAAGGQGASARTTEPAGGTCR
jgi:uncharacterized membrane protein YoaK (UPF0700 family)